MEKMEHELRKGEVYVALKINIRCSKPVSDHKIAIVSMGRNIWRFHLERAGNVGCRGNNWVVERAKLITSEDETFWSLIWRGTRFQAIKASGCA